MKYQLINMDTEEWIAKGICERIGIDGAVSASAAGGRELEYEVKLDSHTQAFQEIKKILTCGECKVIDSLGEVAAVGHRVVQGGSTFNKSVLITDEVIKVVEELSDLAPLHNPANVQGIRACRDVFGPDVPQVAVFDTTFHSTMPEEAYMFAIPYEYYEKYHIRRYGFHGTSHRFVSQRCAEIMGRSVEDLKIVTCHIGNGASITAVKNGRVIDTSMGLTPLDGFIMGTRCGGIDPSILLYLQEKEGWTAKETDAVLNKKSGKLGISGLSSDDRDLVAAMNAGDSRALLALRMQRYQVRKFIGSYAAAMDGVDAIVFTGGVGENSINMRESVCKHLSFLGITFDPKRNEELVLGAEGELSTPQSKVRVFVLPTNEELLIARDTKQVATQIITQL
ncbi:MAG: acetate kinase [Oscillospiraceae bacterium]|nr:acetate kinase [Oscillospiraceae bacterium]